MIRHKAALTVPLPREPMRSGKKNKYERVYEAILKSIDSGQYHRGARLPTESDLMEQFNVSRITVVRALRDLQVRGLVRRRRGSGSFVQGPPELVTKPFGLVVTDVEQGSIFSTIQHILLREAQKLHWHIVVDGITGHETPAIVEQMCRRIVDSGAQGVFYLPQSVSPAQAILNEKIGDFFSVSHVPLVLLDRDLHKLHQRSNFDVVGSDNRQGGFLAAQHLIHRGCRRIVFLTGEGKYPTVESRMAGARDAVQAAGKVKFDVHVGESDDLNFIRGVLSERSPDALMCDNDMTAAKAMRNLINMGIKIPDQIKITGFDDTITASLLPIPLTTVRQAAEVIAINAVLMMNQRLAQPNMPAVTVNIACELIVRQSTQ